MQDIQAQQMILFKALFSLKRADTCTRAKSLNDILCVIEARAFDLSENLKFPCFLKGESALTLAEYYDSTGQASTLLLNAGARVDNRQKNAVLYEETLLRQKIYCAAQLANLLKQLDEFNVGHEKGLFSENILKDKNGEKPDAPFKKAKRKSDADRTDVQPVYFRDMVLNKPAAIMTFIQNQEEDVLQATLFEAIKGLANRDEKEADVCRNFIRYVFISRRLDFEENFNFSREAKYDSPLTAIVAYERSDKLQKELFSAGVGVKKEQICSDVYRKACFRQKFYKNLEERTRC